MKILIFLINAFKIAFLLGFLITIHEGGHFLVAKACKIKVREFAIGFGPKIFSKQGKKETKYTLRLIPFGGYVDMLGEAEREKSEGSFSEAKVSKRLAVVVAGATVNIVFGILVYFILMIYSGQNVSNIIKELSPEYSEKLAELRVGDEILEINNKKIRLKTDIDKAISKSQGDKVVVKIRRNNQIENIDLFPSAIVNKTIGVYFSSSNDIPKVKAIESNSVAENVGIKEGDLITKINDKHINYYYDVLETINNSENDIISVEVERDGEKLNFELKPDEYTTYILGVYLNIAEDNFYNNIYYSYWKTIYFIEEIAQNVKNLVTGNVDINQMVGPIGISEMVVETDGIYNFLYLMSLISLSLGVSNLLPIPALDGGKIVILIIEGIRRKPLKEESEMKIQMLGFTLLIMFSIYISYRDILRIF